MSMKWRQEIDEILARTNFGEVARPTPSKAAGLLAIALIAAIAYYLLGYGAEERARPRAQRRKAAAA